MNILEALAFARDNDTLIRRAGWPKDKALFFKDDGIYINNPETNRWEERLTYFHPESVVADDWVEA